MPPARVPAGNGEAQAGGRISSTRPRLHDELGLRASGHGRKQLCGVGSLETAAVGRIDGIDVGLGSRLGAPDGVGHVCICPAGYPLREGFWMNKEKDFALALVEID